MPKKKEKTIKAWAIVGGNSGELVEFTLKHREEAHLFKTKKSAQRFRRVAFQGGWNTKIEKVEIKLCQRKTKK